MRKQIYVTVLLLVFAGCSEEEKPPFTTGSRFSYATAYTYAEGRITRHDTLSFTIEEPDITSYSTAFKRIKWENTRHDYFQVRNMTVEEDRVELQLPLNYVGFDNEFIAVAGHPLALIAAPEKHVFNEKKEYQDVYGSLDSTIIYQKTKYLRDTAIYFDGQMLPCRLFVKYNASELEKLGRYKIQYTYNPQYGFISIDYFYPNGKHIGLNLIDVAIKGR